jgi:hypothetical protein
LDFAIDITTLEKVEWVWFPSISDV